MSLPVIIQGGMGVAVSGWPLARAVAKLGQLGVVSGTALAVVLARRLQLGDPDGKLRFALGRFPFPEVSARILADHYISGGKAKDAPFKLTAMPTLDCPPALVELTVAANFVEVFLAKDGHDGVVGINFLEKIQLPTLPSIYGAMLAGVDYVLMGAGIPRSIPGVLDALSVGHTVKLRIDVEGALPGEDYFTSFEPKAFCGGTAPQLRRPKFLGVVASATLALTLAKKSNGQVDGFVVEGESAGGHNAPPRGTMELSSSGEPIYGERDIVDLTKIRSIRLPFWLAGSYGQPDKLGQAIEAGASGIQVGTAFAFCEESGVDPELKRAVLRSCQSGEPCVFTDPVASPTGFPFKVMQVPGTLSDPDLYASRQRICDLGYLRHLYRREDGSVGYRCPAEPAEDFVRKGGQVEETIGRKCICNGLPATIGHVQVRPGGLDEPPLVTAGNDVRNIAQFLKPGRESYSAADVIDFILAHPA